MPSLLLLFHNMLNSFALPYVRLEIAHRIKPGISVELI